MALRSFDVMEAWRQHSDPDAFFPRRPSADDGAAGCGLFANAFPAALGMRGLWVEA
ncbi:MAG: hypothetical protein O2905_08345 [Proteobacteria bacterium]|nr:hypothetical protein [Pseudomonadota bacterium]